MRVIVSSTDVTQLASAQGPLGQPPSAPVRAVQRQEQEDACTRSSLHQKQEDAWAMCTGREGLTMPGRACFLQDAGLLSPGKLKWASVLQPCSSHLLLSVFSWHAYTMSLHRHGASKRLSSTVPSTMFGGD